MAILAGNKNKIAGEIQPAILQNQQHGNKNKFT